MPTPSGKLKDHDFATVARRVVEQAIGQHLNSTPLDDPPPLVVSGCPGAGAVRLSNDNLVRASILRGYAEEPKEGIEKP